MPFGEIRVGTSTPRLGVTPPPPPSPGATSGTERFQVAEGASQPGGRRRGERRVRAGAAALGPGPRGPRGPRPAPRPGGQASEATSPLGRYSEKELCPDGLCLLNVVFLSPLSPTPPARFLPPPPPPSPLFLPNRSLFMIAWITEEEIRSPLKERCHTELRHTSREEEELRGAWGSLCPRGWCRLAPLRICLCCVPNSSAEVCERPLGSLSLTPVSSSPSSVPGCLAWRGLLTSVESRGLMQCVLILLRVGGVHPLRIPGVITLSVEREARKGPVARVKV